jgi:fibronectin type 3 domain-containing protein
MMPRALYTSQHTFNLENRDAEMKPANLSRSIPTTIPFALWCLVSILLPVRVGHALGAEPQQQPLPFLVTSTDTEVFLLVLDMPSEARGFNVYRKGPGDQERRLVTPSPVVAVTDPAAARRLMGDDFPWIARALRVQDPFEVVRRFRSDPGAAVAVSLASLRAAAVAGRVFVDDAVEKDRTYEYHVDLVDLAGEVLRTSSLSLRIGDRRPQPAPGAVTVEAGDGTIGIDWDFPVYGGDPEDVVIGFHVYRSEADGAFERLQPFPILRQDDLTYRVDTGVDNARTYSYYVTAVDYIGRESEPSATVAATPEDMTPPSFPREVEVFAEQDMLLITWRMNLELDLSHYDVYRSLELEDGYEKINVEPVPAAGSSYRDADVYSGPLYHYKVKAVDFAGNESDFSNAATGRPEDNGGPEPPLDFVAEVFGHEVTLRWSAPPDPDLEGYFVYRKRDDQEYLPLTPRPLSVDTTWIVDSGYDGSGLWPGKKYVYAVAALDHAFNESLYSTAEVTIPDDDPPTPPAESYARSTEEGYVEIEWQPSLALDLLGYRVYRAAEGEEPVSLVLHTADVFSTVDTTAARGRTYSYYVVAVDMAGNQSENTEPTIVTPRDLFAPPPPTSVEALFDAGGVLLSWNEVQVRDLVGYHVYRSDSPYGSLERLTDNPIFHTVFRDPAGRTGQYYRVSTLDTSGHENLGSEPVEVRAEAGSF